MKFQSIKNKSAHNNDTIGGLSERLIFGLKSTDGPALYNIGVLLSTSV